MDVNDQKEGINQAVRLSVINHIMKYLMARNQNPTVVSKAKEVAIRLEVSMYRSATSKDDYLAKIQNKLSNMMPQSFADVPSSAAENQPMVQNQVVHSSQFVQQNFNANSSSLQENHTLIPNTPPPIHAPGTPMPMPMPILMSTDSSTTMMDHQNILQGNNLQLPSVQEPSWPIDMMPNRGSYQQPSQLSRLMPMPMPMPMPTDVQNSQMSSTSVYPQTSVVPHSQVVTCTEAPSASVLDAETVSAADRKLLMNQYYLARKTYLPELTRVYKRAEEGAKALDCEIAKRSSIIRSVCEHHIKFLQSSENDLLHFPKEIFCQNLNKVAQFFNIKRRNQAPQVSNRPVSVNGLQNTTPSVEHATIISNPMISSSTMEKVLRHSQANTPVSPGLHGSPHATKQVDLTVLSKGKGSQGTSEQNSPSVVHATIVSNPMISSSTMEKVFHHSQSNTPVSPGLYGSPNATKRIDIQTVLNKGKGSQDTSEQNTHLNPKRNLEPTQPSDMDQPLKKQKSLKPRKQPKEKDFMDSMFISSTKITSRNAQGRPSRCRPPATKQPSLQIKNTSCISDPRAVVQHKPSIVAVGSALTPETPSSVPKEIRTPAESSVSPTELRTVTAECQTSSASDPGTPSSVPKEIRKPGESFVSPTELREVTTECQTDVQDKSIDLGTSGSTVSSVPSEICDAESNQLPSSDMPPVERLIKAVQSAYENGTLKETVNDMAAAIYDMDKLPEEAYASYDEYYSLMSGEDLEIFSQGLDYVTEDIFGNSF